DLKERYRTDGELIADLEEVLALETSRAGRVTGEATTVLRTLPQTTRHRIPLMTRRPAWFAVAGLLATVAAIVVVIGLLGHQTTRGPGTVPPDRQAQAARLTAISLGSNAAHDFDPLGDHTEHATQTPAALDNDPSTFWSTENYIGGTLNKPGVGIY